MTSILQVRELHVTYRPSDGATNSLVHALNGISFDLSAGEILGVLGESGSGKSTLAASLLRLLPPNGEINGGSITLDGSDLLRANSRTLQATRGARISIIHQEPSLALHPTICIGDQICEVLRAHSPSINSGQRGQSLRQQALDVLSNVFSSDLDRIYSSYPHQLSGGQRQRALIAQAISCRPALLIADEPTASLDPTTQREILVLFKTLRAKFNLATILITHNPALLAGFADRVLVLYAGEVAELGPAEEVLFTPCHPYTTALLRCMPQFQEAHLGTHASLPTISGAPPNLNLLPQGCTFEPRCADRMLLCLTHHPDAVPVSAAHAVSCLKFGS